MDRWGAAHHQGQGRFETHAPKRPICPAPGHALRSAHGPHPAPRTAAGSRRSRRSRGHLRRRLAARHRAGGRPRVRLAVSSYSYWHFKTEKYPIEQVIEHAASLGFDGVEILHRGMTDETAGYLANLKRLAFRNSIDLAMLSIHQDF